MKLLLILCSLLFSISFSTAETLVPASEAEMQLHKSYLDTKNSFLRSLKQRNELTQLKSELDALNKTIKKQPAGAPGHIVQELEENRLLLSTKIELLSQKQQKVLQRITDISPANEPYNLVNFFTQSPLKNCDEAVETLLAVRNEHQQALSTLKQFLRDLKERTPEALRNSNAYKAFYSDVLQDQRYLNSLKSLIDKQYDYLLDQRTETQKRYYTYRDQKLFKHALSLAVIFSLFVGAYMLRRGVVRYIPEDDRQFTYNRTISTSAALIGLVFILITYSENIIYSLTVFTFIGAAAVIATREFWLNVVAWVYIALSNFIKVGDRILVPHETKYYFGDIIKISPVKITLYEAYDFSSTKEAVTAGRIIFLPNSYIFSHAVINYTHQSQKTVYDHITFNLTLESDLQLAETITRDILKEETARYLDEAKQQFDSLKKRYDVKQRMLEPEIQFTVNTTSTAIKMTAWYMTPNQQTTLVKNRLLGLLLKRLGEAKGVQFTRKTKSEKEVSDESSES